MSRLAEIFAHKRAELADRQVRRPPARVCSEAAEAPAAVDFVAALRAAPSRPALIAEIKAASPSRGVLATDFDPVGLAEVYAMNGATAISVLTDERFFHGALAHLEAVRRRLPHMPLLRKDFMFDPYQIYEARAAGADAVLLIAAALSQAQLGELQALAQSLGMAALIEVHTGDELARALDCRPTVIGINNRNLHDFNVSLETTTTLAPYVPPEICLVAESGIFTAHDRRRLKQILRAGAGQGVDAILVGEALVTAPDVAAKTRELSQDDL